MNYEGKVVVVTGGSKGIGLGCVKVFVEEGGSNVVFCARNAAEGAAVEAAVNARGGPGRAALRSLRRRKVDDVRALIDGVAQSARPHRLPDQQRRLAPAPRAHRRLLRARTSATCSS